MSDARIEKKNLQITVLVDFGAANDMKFPSGDKETISGNDFFCKKWKVRKKRVFYFSINCSEIISGLVEGRSSFQIVCYTF